MKDIKRLTAGLLSNSVDMDLENNKIFWLLKNNLWNRSLREQEDQALKEKVVSENKKREQEEAKRIMETPREKPQNPDDQSTVLNQPKVIVEEKDKRWALKYRKAVIEGQEDDMPDLYTRKRKKRKVQTGNTKIYSHREYDDTESDYDCYATEESSKTRSLPIDEYPPRKASSGSSEIEDSKYRSPTKSKIQTTSKKDPRDSIYNT